MEKLGLLTALFFLSFSAATCQPNINPCDSPQHHQFDFWIGDWNVSDTLGVVIGHNSILDVQGHCALEENWRSVNGFTGTSYNYFNPADSSWNQLWLDQSGTILNLKGGLIGTQMVLRSAYQTGQSGRLFCNRISWSPQENGSVLQIWDILDENDAIQQCAFHGIYRKTKQ